MSAYHQQETRLGSDLVEHGIDRRFSVERSIVVTHGARLTGQDGREFPARVWLDLTSDREELSLAEARHLAALLSAAADRAEASPATGPGSGTPPSPEPDAPGLSSAASPAQSGSKGAEASSDRVDAAL
jgi:hypothetical protein